MQQATPPPSPPCVAAAINSITVFSSAGTFDSTYTERTEGDRCFIFTQVPTAAGDPYSLPDLTKCLVRELPSSDGWSRYKLPHIITQADIKTRDLILRTTQSPDGAITIVSATILTAKLSPEPPSILSDRDHGLPVYRKTLTSVEPSSVRCDSASPEVLDEVGQTLEVGQAAQGWYPYEVIDRALSEDDQIMTPMYIRTHDSLGGELDSCEVELCLEDLE